MKKFLIKLILFIWEIIQNIVGYLYLKLSKYKFTLSYFPNGSSIIKYYYSKDFPGGLTLGEFIFTNGPKHVKHESGHVKQSRILGPLYLPLIGLNSILHAALHDCKAHGKEYDHFWTEKWADHLGGNHDKV